MTDSGLIAITRGLTPSRAADIGAALYGAGFRAIEVPFNSPDPLESIRILRDVLAEDCLVGAGTVLTVEQVEGARDAGAEIIVSPNTAPDVIARTVALGLESFPGAATPTEAFAAIAAGARNVKLFPASTIGVAGMKAWRSVLPTGTRLLPVGGVEVENLTDWAAAGADGAGIGGSLFTPDMTTDEVALRAARFVEAWTSATR